MGSEDEYDGLAECLIARQLGREITKKEALEIVWRSEEAGLVHLVDNARYGIKRTCNCCGCCCRSVGSIRRKTIPSDILMATYFLRETDEEKCTGCGNCAEICSAGCVTIEEGIAVADRDWCVGCGVCVARSPTTSIKLVRRPGVLSPKNFKELHTQILKEKPAS